MDVGASSRAEYSRSCHKPQVYYHSPAERERHERRKISVCDLSAELIGISRIITGLSNQLEAKKTDTLTVESLRDALFGVSRHLDRIADDLISME